MPTATMVAARARSLGGGGDGGGGTGGGACGDGDGGRGIGGADGSVPWGTGRAVRVGVGRAHPTDVQ